MVCFVSSILFLGCGALLDRLDVAWFLGSGWTWLPDDGGNLWKTNLIFNLGTFG